MVVSNIPWLALLLSLCPLAALLFGGPLFLSVA
jgi:hypothetical protein